MNRSEAPFPPVDAPAMLYPGTVMHARLKPFGHRFSYKVFSCLLDLDRLDEADGLSSFFSVNKPNLVSFREADHIGEDDRETSLREYASRLVEEQGLERPHSIQLLCYPRIFGYVFNPLSVFYCRDAAGRLTALIYEVRNTFGGRHCYVCPVEPGQTKSAGIRQQRTKTFYVSPFIELGARYHFRMLPPGDAVRLRILETENGEPLLSATFSGTARPFTSANLAAQLAALPLMTFKVMAGIHWEALKIWLKGGKFHPRPDAAHAAEAPDIADKTLGRSS